MATKTAPKVTANNGATIAPRHPPISQPPSLQSARPGTSKYGLTPLKASAQPAMNSRHPKATTRRPGSIRPTLALVGDVGPLSLNWPGQALLS